MTPRELSHRLNAQAESVCKHLLPNGKRHGAEWVIGSLTGEAGDSCRVHLGGEKVGVWADFASGEKGGDLLDLWGAVRRLDLSATLREVKAYLGIADPEFDPAARRQYARPNRPKGAKRPSAVADYLNKRGITDATIAAFQIGEIIDAQGRPAIVFPYKRDGELVGIKYLSLERGEDGKKHTWSEKDCEPCLFGWQALSPTVRAVALTEGECFPGDAEILTPQGWIRFDQYSGGQVLQVDSNLAGQFVYPLATIAKPYSGEFIRHETKGWVSVTTPQHQLVSIMHHTRGLHKHPACEVVRSRLIPRTVQVDGPGITLEDAQIRLAIAISADASVDARKAAYAGAPARNLPKASRYARFGLKKPRKIERLRALLRDCEIEASDNPLGKRGGCSQLGYQSICFSIPDFLPDKALPWEWIALATSRQRELILEEIMLWDGNQVPNRNQFEYSSKDYSNASWVQALAHSTGRCSSIIARRNEYGEWFKVSILHGKQHSSWQSVKSSRIEHQGMVYCVQVPSGMLLVRQEGKVTVTGNCDAMTLHQFGIQALSVPNGAGAHQWLEGEYGNLERFDQIFVWFDTDAPGKKGAMELIDRLGRHRCRLVQCSYKDPNEALMAGAGLSEFAAWIAQAKTLDPDELKNAAVFTEQVIAEFYPSGDVLGVPVPWDRLQDKVRFRSAEVSIWTGLNGSGKSLLLGFLAIHFMSLDNRVCIASMEMAPRRTLYRMVRQATGMRLPSQPYIEAVQAWLGERLWLFDVLGSAKVDTLLSVMEYARRRYAVSQFVVDSLAKCGMAEDDYNAQKALVERLTDFARGHNVHVHLVVHPRKQDDENDIPGKMDVKGTGAITDMADNVFSVWRNKRKEIRLRELEGCEDEQIVKDVEGKPDVKITCSKQRNGEWEGGIALWFDRESWQYCGSPGEPRRRYVAFSESDHAEPSTATRR